MARPGRRRGEAGRDGDAPLDKISRCRDNSSTSPPPGHAPGAPCDPRRGSGGADGPERADHGVPGSGTPPVSLGGNPPPHRGGPASRPARAPEITGRNSAPVGVSDDSIRVLDPTGERIDDGSVTGGSGAYAVGLGSDLPDGTYTVVWQVVSADSHPVGGAFTFSIGAPSPTAAPVPETVPGGGLPGFLYDTARWTAYAGFLLLVGGSAFVLRCRPEAAGFRPVRRLIVLGWTLMTAASLALLVLRAPYLSGEMADLTRWSAVRDVVTEGWGTALVSRLLLLAAAGMFLAVLLGTWARLTAPAGQGAPVPGPGAVRGGDGAGGSGATGDGGDKRGDKKEDAGGDGGDAGGDGPDDAGRREAARRDLSFGLTVGGGIVACGLAATWALSEHASTGPQTSVAIPMDIVHLLAAAVWLGGLATLALLLFRDPGLPRETVRRFSRLAFGSVVLLVITGVYQSWRQVGSADLLFSTGYGQLLVTKAALVLLLLVVAGISRRWTALLTDPEPTAPEPTAPGGGPGGGTGGAEPEPALVGAPADVNPPTDPARAAQLARQRAAVQRAERHRALTADPERAGLRRSVLVETLIAVVVLVVTTALTGTPPARTAADAPAEAGTVAPAEGITLELPFAAGGPNGTGTALVDVEPAVTGENVLHVRTVDPDGEPMSVEEVRVALVLPAEDIGPLRFEPLRVDTDHWTVTDMQLPRPGEWGLSLTIRTSEINQVTETDILPIG
ncbi:copper resistance CopC/CopD family protein [Streptomyces calidiresistens]|uniref:copper resistance CopC/CopD family protein n=1 Tax=Streptomyces calidiresistens TaxID=1485586 RepID=UPI0015FC0C61|nr:CopD family protein [Streptomyces calidiresistens]